MACFIVPVAEAIVATTATHILKSREKKLKKIENVTVQHNGQLEVKVPFSRKLKWLSNLLWGGSLLLAFEHMWNGEIQPFFPFFTAAKDTEATFVMLQEMKTVGICMALIVTVAWVSMLVVSHVIEKHADHAKMNIEMSETL